MGPMLSEYDCQQCIKIKLLTLLYDELVSLKKQIYEFIFHAILETTGWIKFYD
jgi:hypothetical protein